MNTRAHKDTAQQSSKVCVVTSTKIPVGYFLPNAENVHPSVHTEHVQFAVQSRWNPHKQLNNMKHHRQS
jgi:hypothetical protein